MFDALFADPKLRTAWDTTRSRATQCRMRLWIDADDLHRIPWELLNNGTAALAASAVTPFSRYLPTEHAWGHAVAARPIRVLAAISNPKDIEVQHNLLSLDEVVERAILKDAFSSLDAREILLDFLDAPITLEWIEKVLREGYHSFHYVGHGMFNALKGQAALYLQDKDGNTHIVRDADLAYMLARQGVQPRLAVLAACQSAARAAAGTFLGLAPQLIAAGVPAVVAMQDKIATKTARRFSLAFYQDLIAHGTVDQAVNAARSILLSAERPDAAVPVLFMRLKDGQLWRDAEESGVMPQAIAAHRAALREQLAREARALGRDVGLYPGGGRENLIRTLHAAQRLLVLREPGSGKTVALERLAVVPFF